MELDKIEAKLRARINGLMDRGKHICQDHVPSHEGATFCDRCGYSDDTHLIRDALLLIDDTKKGLARIERIVYDKDLDLEMRGY